MFEDLPFEPTFTFEGSGIEVLHVHAEESHAIYIDGKKVASPKSAHKEAVFRAISESSDGNLSAYGSSAAVFHRETEESLYNEELPDDPSDIIYSEEIGLVSIRNSDDLKNRLQTTSSHHNYVMVEVWNDSFDEDFVRDFMSEKFEQFVIDVYIK